MTRLEDSGPSDQSSYWLVLARIFELALFCAGRYADNGELSAAGDLLVNPRKVLIRQKGHPHKLVKQRHGRISDQLNKGGRCEKHLFLLLKHEVAFEIAQPAILPHLFERMQGSRKIASWYLQHASERMKKIAEAIGFYPPALCPALKIFIVGCARHRRRPAVLLTIIYAGSTHIFSNDSAGKFRS